MQAHTFQVSVVMQKARVTGPMSRWQTWQWRLDRVIDHDPGHGTAPQRLHQDDDLELWLFPAFTVELHRDDAEGYYLNATSEVSCWFVMWRMIDHPSGEPIAQPQLVSLSYHMAGRLLDAQESLESTPVAPEIKRILLEFAEEHYQIEPKKRQRPASFRGLQDRFGNPAKVSTSKPRKGSQ